VIFLTFVCFHRRAQSTCNVCDPGSYSDLDGFSDCLGCATGAFQLFSNRTSCDLCLPGTFSDTLGAVTCSDCLPGESGGVGAIECTVSNIFFGVGVGVLVLMSGSFSVF